MSIQGTPAPIISNTPAASIAAPAPLTTSYVYPYSYVPYAQEGATPTQPMYYYGAPVAKEGEEAFYYYPPYYGTPYGYDATAYAAPAPATKSVKSKGCCGSAPKPAVAAPVAAEVPATQAYLVQTKEDGTQEYVPLTPEQYESLAAPEAAAPVVAEKKAKKKCC